MELNEVTKHLPRHLLQFVVEQPYNAYTPVDQAVWRYVMRQNHHHLQRVAHESYVQGLHITGVETEQIPTMYGMNRILKDIGWAAVAVDGFIPPGAFMEFTKYNVLVIAADIRTLDHIEYTPAPDIIHESAGHAPILAVPEFAAYLKHIGEAGSKSFTSKKDIELYEAIRHLSIIKEDPNTNEAEVREAEAAIDRIQQNMGPPSEMALIRNLHWWTVEYGLVGTPHDFKLYGAGLLSSIGEATSCLDVNVKKLPYTLEAMHCNYDITRPQPQLFVTPDFAHLTVVLEEFKKRMAWTTGGLDGILKAIASEQTATLEYSSGLQVTGTFTSVLDDDGEPAFIRTSGPAALALADVQLKGYDKTNFTDGFCSPVGKLITSSVPLEEMGDDELRRNGIEKGKPADLRLEHSIDVQGYVRQIVRSPKGKIILIKFGAAVVRRHHTVLLSLDTFNMAVGERIVSAFAGAADPDAFEPAVFVPHERMHKIHYNESARRLHELYRVVREARNDSQLLPELPATWNSVVRDYPHDWLLSLEILELLMPHAAYTGICRDVREYLENKCLQQAHLKNLIVNGLKLLNE